MVAAQKQPFESTATFKFEYPVLHSQHQMEAHRTPRMASYGAASSRNNSRIAGRDDDAIVGLPGFGHRCSLQAPLQRKVGLRTLVDR
jgi:hypothetical protein